MFISVKTHDVSISTMKNDHYYADIQCSDIIRIEEKEFIKRKRLETIKSVLSK